MTSRRVSLDVVVDDADERLCGADCPYASKYMGGTVICELDGKTVREPRIKPTVMRRSEKCLSAEALAAADDAVLEAADPSETADSDTLETVEETALAIIDSLKKEFGDALTPETDDERDVAVRRYFARLREAIDARRKLRATRGTEG